MQEIKTAERLLRKVKDPVPRAGEDENIYSLTLGEKQALQLKWNSYWA